MRMYSNPLRCHQLLEPLAASSEIFGLQICAFCRGDDKVQSELGFAKPNFGEMVASDAEFQRRIFVSL